MFVFVTFDWFCSCSSFVAHKELRFMTPLVPLMNVLAAEVLTRFRQVAVEYVVIYNQNMKMC